MDTRLRTYAVEGNIKKQDLVRAEKISEKQNKN
jgi:hypothetical protein